MLRLAIDTFTAGVLNVPCGVESLHNRAILFHVALVPNVPCGVESLKSIRNVFPFTHCS